MSCLEEQVLYDFVDWEQISVSSVFTVKRHSKLQEAQADLETQNISGAQRAQLQGLTLPFIHIVSQFIWKSKWQMQWLTFLTTETQYGERPDKQREPEDLLDPWYTYETYETHET